MSRKSKLFFSLVSLCFSIAVLCFGVYSALSVSYSISGSVSYEINDVFVELDLSVYRAMSTTPVNSATHNQNVSTIKDAGNNISETDFGKLSYTDHKSTYENGVVTNPGQEWSTSSPDLDLTYGSPTNDNQGYAFYIVIDIHNLGSEIINAQITAPTSLENTILRDSGNVEITADGTERIVLGLAIDDVTTDITSADFTYKITISRGELPEVEPITDMTFAFNEENKTATLTSYTGSDTVVEIPETIGSIKQTTKTLGPYADINTLMTSLTGTSTGMVDMFLVGDISYTSGNEQKVDKNQMIYSWMQDSNNASCTNITIECQSSYTLTVLASDMENEVGMAMLLGPAAGYVMVASSDNPTILDIMNMSYTAHLNNEEFYIDKNAVMQFIESNSGDIMDYTNLIDSLIEGGTQEITVTFEDILYGYTAIMSSDYTVTNIGTSSQIYAATSPNEVMPVFPSSVESISLPNTLTYIRYRAFEGTQWLEGLRNQEGYNGIIISKDGSVRYYHETPQSAQLTAEYVNTILQDVQFIGDMVFYQTELSGDIVIPNGVKGIGMGVFMDTTINSVTFGVNSQLESIGENVFDGCSALETVTFGANSQLESIGIYAFSGCSNLTGIEIPSGVTSIGDSAFRDCSALKTVTFGANSQLESIGEDAFWYCSNLTSIEIPSSVTSIGSYVFGSCSALETVTFGANSQLESIGSFAFRDCSNLTSIEIPSGVTSIGEYTFSDCDALERVNITDIDAWAMIDFGNNNLLSYGAGLYLNGELVTEVTLTTATKITDRAFYGYDSLTSITIPSSVTSIGGYAFYNCNKLENITVDPSNANYCSDEYGVLFNKDKTELIQYPIGNTRTQYTIPSSVTSIGEYAFCDCSALGTVTFGANSHLESIGSFAFESCSSLTSIEIPSSVTSIGSLAFWMCYALAEVYNYSTQIPEVTIGNSSYNTNGYLGEYAKVVYNPSDLIGEKPATRIQTRGDVQYYVYGEDFIALAPSVARDSLITLALNSGTTEINRYAFSSCYNLTSIEIPSSVTSIGEHAFRDCSALETVTFEDIESVWVLDDTSNTEISITEHTPTPQVLATYLKSTYNSYTWTKKQSA